jgi:hypothetical protein
MLFARADEKPQVHKPDLSYNLRGQHLAKLGRSMLRPYASKSRAIIMR